MRYELIGWVEVEKEGLTVSNEDSDPPMEIMRLDVPARDDAEAVTKAIELVETNKLLHAALWKMERISFR
jgi:hypothetical protein